MSFIDKLGETLQDMGWFVGAPAATAIDIAKAALPGGTPFTQGAVKAVTTGFDRGTQLFFGDQTGDDAGTQNLASPAVNKVMDGIDWAYREVLSQPINFGNIESQRLLADLTGTEDGASPLDFGSAWDRADNKTGGYDGKGTSIGREWTNLMGGVAGLATKPFDLLGGPHIPDSVRFASLTDEGQRTLDQGKSWKDGGKSYDLVSGGIDAIGRIFLDPTIIGGKAVKAARLSKVVAGISDPAKISAKLESHTDGLFAGFGARHDAALKFATAPDRSAGELLAAFPGLRNSLDGESVASVLEQTNKAMRAAGKSDDEIVDQAKLVTRASMGDASALDNIDQSVAFAKDALASMKSNRDDLKMASEWATKYGDRVKPEDIQEAAQHLNLVKDLELRGRDYFTSDEFLKLTKARLDSSAKDIRAAEQEVARQQRVQNLFRDGENGAVRGTFGSGSDAPLLSSTLGSGIPLVGGTRKLERAAKRERGENVGLDFVFQTTAWNKGVKVLAPHIYLMQKAHGAYGRMAAPPVINVEDEKAGQALNTWLKHTGLDSERRLDLVSRMAGSTSKVQRGQVIDEAIEKGVDASIAAHRAKNPLMTDEAEKLVRLAIQKQMTKDGARSGVQSQMFTAAKRAEGTEAGPVGSRGDMVVDEDGLVKFYPVLPTQITSIYQMPNLKNVDHILNRHSNWITDMAEWAKGNRAPDPSRVEAIGQKVFGGLGEKMPKLSAGLANFSDDRVNSVNDFVWKSEEVAKAILDGFNHIWKAGTLATRPIAYAMRVNVDSGMRFAATMGPAAWLMHSAPRVFGHATVGTATGAKYLLKSYADSQAELKLRKAMERIEDAFNSRELERRVAFEASRQEARASDRVVIRYQEPGAARSATEKPHGMYYSYNRPGFESPHAEDYGIKPDVLHAQRAPGAKVLEVNDARVKHERFGRSLDGDGGHREGNASSGVAALKALLPEKQFDAVLKMTKEELAAKLSKEFPGADYSKYYDSYELLEAYAGQLARKRGYDAISLKKAYDKQFDEYVALTDRALEDVPKYERSAVEGDPEYAAMKAAHEAISKRLDQFRNGGRKGRREAYGAIGESGRKSLKTRAGEIEGAFSGEQGLRNRYLISSETSAAMLGDSWKLGTKDAQLGNWGYVENIDPKHMENWLHAVNAQLMQSSVGREAVRLMVEFNDPAKASAQLARWATGTAEGRKLMSDLVWTARDKRAYTNEIIGYVNHYLPSRELRAATHEKGRITQQELESALPDPMDRPPVHGESLAIVTNRGSALGEMINGTVKRIMKWAGDATEDQLARHPMYVAVYEQEAKRRAEFLMADPRIQKLDGIDIQRLVQDQAHKKARQAIKDYMFDIAATSDLSHYMRFTSPFIAAWEDTVRKWGRIVKENPELIGRGIQIWNAPNAMGIVVDEDGNPVERDGIFGYTDPKTGEKKSTYLLVPQGLTKWMPGAGDSQLKISKQSLNIVLQGGLQPGFGPLVAYPVAKIQTAAPQLDQVAKLVNPYGPPDSVWDALAPSTFKAIHDATNEQSRTHEQDTRRIWAQMLAEYKLDPQKFGGKQPTIDEASARAGALGRLKIINRVAGLPIPGFPAIFQSPYQLYIDSYRALQERERAENHPHGWADDQFVEQFGDTYFPLVQSESLNNAGVGATAESVTAYNQYKSLINKYGVEAGQANKNLVRLIIGQEGEGEFNQSAHQWQQTHEISPASGVMFRSYENPQAAQADADASLGWLKYRQFMNTLDAQALQQGLRTYQDDADLIDTRRQFIENLAQENPAWHVDWSQRDSDKFERDLQSLGEVANSGKFGPMRTDMEGVRQYLALREALKAELDEYGVGYGTQDAQPFRQEFTDAVMDLVSQNSQFAEWSYYTFLERDPLLEPLTSTEQPTDKPPTDWGIS